MNSTFRGSIIAMILLLSGIVVYLLFHQAPRIVYVDSAKMLNGYQAMLDGRKDFQGKLKNWQSRVDTLSINVQQAIKVYERQAAGMSAKERASAQQEISTKQRQLAEYQQAVRQNAQQDEAEANKKILTTVNAFLSEYGKHQHYDLVLIASQAGTIAYARPGLDVTAEVVAELNKVYIKTRAE